MIKCNITLKPEPVGNGPIFCRVISGSAPDGTIVKFQFADPADYHNTLRDIHECTDYQLEGRVINSPEFKNHGIHHPVSRCVATITRGRVTGLIIPSMIGQVD